MALTLNRADEYRLKAVAKRLYANGIILNCSLGTGTHSGVQYFGLYFDLTYNDFAPTDLAMEMLYVLEAKTAIWSASRELTNRLQGAKIRAEKQAYSDPLTRLQNFKALEVVVSRLIMS